MASAPRGPQQRDGQAAEWGSEHHTEQRRQRYGQGDQRRVGIGEENLEIVCIVR